LSARLVRTQRTWRFRLPATFYGLSEDYKLGIYEEFFALKYHGGWSFFEAYNLPVAVRRWFLQRLIDQKEKEKEQHDAAMKSAKHKR
jgi:hypothetical protein